MSDGPQSPDFPRPTTEVTFSGVPSAPEKSSRFGWAQRFIGRGSQADSGPRNIPEAAANQTKQPEVKNKSVLEQLHSKNEQLGGNLTLEYSEGDKQFTILRHSLDTRGDKYPTPVSYEQDTKAGYVDRLIVTAQGTMILRVKVGDYKPIDPNSEFAQRYPGVEDTLDINAEATMRNDVVSTLLGRTMYKDRSGFEGYTAGSCYSQNGNEHTFNFGQDHQLTFRSSEPGWAYVTGVSKPIVDKTPNPWAGGLNMPGVQASVLQELKRGFLSGVTLILKPDQAEVAEIMQFNLTQAKNMQESARKRAEEERQRKEQEAQAAVTPTPEPQPDQKQQIEEAQAKATDTILDLLTAEP